PRGENLLGEVLGRVGLRGGCSRGGFARGGGPARATESLAEGQLSATLRAGQGERAAAVLAKPQPVAVLGAAPRARHRRADSAPPWSCAPLSSTRTGSVKVNVDP